MRSEIEQQEGRLRLLAQLTALTTVTVSVEEIKNYVPPRAPTFARMIHDTFFGSIDVLATFGRGVVLMMVAVVPWLPVAAVVGLPIVLLGGRRTARGSTAG